MTEPRCVLFHDNFQNFKSYNIPKAQLVIADIPYNIGSDFYASRPDWYVDGDNRNGESDKARKAAFNTDFTFNIAEYFHFCNRLLKKEPMKGKKGAPCMIVFCAFQQIPKVISVIREWIASGFTIPPAISEIPGIGPWLHDQLLFAIDPASLSTTMQKLLEPLSAALLNAAVNVSNILLQLALVTFIVFFFYRDGAWFADRVQALMKRVSGDLSNELTKILVNTTRSVVFGLVGTALGQAVVAGIGFWIAGVPGILMLCTLVFVLSIVPIGPPLVWGPSAIWLYSQGETGMAVFLVLWGLLAVSSVDNFLKPILIARGSSLPLALIFLGVFGGVIAFGFLGLILGPILLAVGLSMLQAWLKNPILAAKLDPDRPRRSRRPIKREKRESTQTKGNSLDNPSDQENTSE